MNNACVAATLFIKVAGTRETSTGVSPAALALTLNVDTQDLLVSRDNVTCDLAANIDFHVSFERNMAHDIWDGVCTKASWITV
jgi:hypothetical protein